jgi:UDP-glucose 4-epimerase
MNILITGGSGFIGSRIADFFKKNHNVICTYYNNPIKIKNVKKIKLNLTKKIIIKKKIDLIIHCASKTSLNSSKDSIMLSQNIKMIKNLLDFVKKKNIKNFVFLSSVSAYGKINKRILFENHKPKNLSTYGKSKLICEKLLSNFSQINKDFKFLSIRLPGVVGYGSHGNFISDLTNKIISGKKIQVSNKLSYFNNIIFVNDLAKFVMEIIKTKNLKCMSINIASDKKIRIVDVIKFIYFRLNIRENVQWIKKKNQSFCIDFSNALKCGYKPISVKKSLTNFTNDYLKRL